MESLKMDNGTDIKNKPVFLIFPPHFAIDQPYISVPQLVAYLKKQDISVEQIDANIDSFYFFMDKGYLKNKFELIKKRLSSLSKNSLEYQFLFRQQIWFDKVYEKIYEAIKYFKTLDKKVTDIFEYNFYKNIIAKAFQIVSAAHFPTQISFNNFNMRFSNQSLSDILQATKSPENPYLEYYNQNFLKRFLFSEFKVVGFSVTCLAQIIPAFTIAAILREKYPFLKIVMGGQVFYRLRDNLKRLIKVCDLLDYIVLGEGETALSNLVKYLNGLVSIEEVPNLLYTCNNKICETSLNYRENIHEMPVPEYDKRTVGKYLSPKLVIQYQPARGCYWHKCSFCNHFITMGLSFRSKKADEM